MVIGGEMMGYYWSICVHMVGEVKTTKAAGPIKIIMFFHSLIAKFVCYLMSCCICCPECLETMQRFSLAALSIVAMMTFDVMK